MHGAGGVQVLRALGLQLWKPSGSNELEWGFVFEFAGSGGVGV